MLDSLTIDNHRFRLVASADRIEDAVREVAARINTDYADLNPLFISVLNGAYVFTADLLRHITLPTHVSFIRLQSYEGMTSSGQVDFLVPLQVDISGRDIIIIEDIVDSGLTMSFLKHYLLRKGAASVRIASFVFKPDALRFPEAHPDYYGLSLPTSFLIGYGMDYTDGTCRNLPALFARED